MVLRSFTSDPAVTFLVAPVEHTSILNPLSEAEGRIRWLKVDSSGRIDIDDVVRKGRANEGQVVLALQAANSETGVIQQVAEIVRALRAVQPTAFVHLDAAPAIGRAPLDLLEMDVDAVAFSGHELHGPAGTGALVLRDSATRIEAADVRRRPGTRPSLRNAQRRGHRRARQGAVDRRGHFV